MAIFCNFLALFCVFFSSSSSLLQGAVEGLGFFFGLENSEIRGLKG